MGEDFRRPALLRALDRLIFVLTGPKRRRSLTRRGDPRLQAPLPPSHPEELTHLSIGVSLGIIFFACAIFLAWGLVVYYSVGMKWPPPWSFGEVQDLPASSEYSTEMGHRFLRTGRPEHSRATLPQPQHVMREPERRAAPPSRGRGLE